jgi:hypothetical protein
VAAVKNANVRPFGCIGRGILYLVYVYVFNNAVNSSCYVEKKFKMHSIVIFPAVLYGCEAWFLTLSGEK